MIALWRSSLFKYVDLVYTAGACRAQLNRVGRQRRAEPLSGYKHCEVFGFCRNGYSACIAFNGASLNLEPAMHVAGQRLYNLGTLHTPTDQALPGAVAKASS